jgi:hypothetical protein
VALHRSEPSPAETLTASAAVSTITEEIASVKDQPKHCQASSRTEIQPPVEAISVAWGGRDSNPRPTDYESLFSNVLTCGDTLVGCLNAQLGRSFLTTSDDLRRLLANLRSNIIAPCLPGRCRDETGRKCVS